ncbi:MAG: hypothetical protein H0X26_07975 [Alphaproteobacteria bacterium]|nr:hypothetical protein [Alphaproteobacteria bacterium]
MLNFLIRIFIIFPFFYSGNLFAMFKADAEDIELSKRSFLISGMSYNENDRSKGAMTLCFKTIESRFGGIDYQYEHAALVFEMFFPKIDNDVHVQMIHYVYDDGSFWGRERNRPWIDHTDPTLRNVYRACATPHFLSGEKHYQSAKYTRYASWSLPTEDLIKGYNLAFDDVNAHEENRELENSYSSITYVKRIMQAVGLKNVDFGWWRENGDNLKILVDQYITPRPDYTQYEEITLPTI